MLTLIALPYIFFHEWIKVKEINIKIRYFLYKINVSISIQLPVIQKLLIYFDVKIEKKERLIFVNFKTL